MKSVSVFHPHLLGLLAAAVLTLPAFHARAADTAPPTGRDLAYDSRKGNCLACHAMPGDPKAITSTNIAPPLVMMRERFPDRKKLYAQIWDPMRANPDTAMPPFGRHHILSDEEIERVVDYIYGL
jgi:sulfur-oxidizing protein SoxX